MSNQIDASIPVLTEIIQPGTQFSPAVAPGAATIAAPVNQITGSDAVSNTAPTAMQLSEEDWQKLEQTLRENVLRQVLSRVDFVLEHRVRDSLADVLQTAVESLAIEIRGGLHKTMEEVITRAVTQEITKVKITK